MPNKPPGDPTRWYPLGQYVEDEDGGDAGDGPKTFTLARSDMAALNRFTQTGRKLPQTRSDYQVQMGLTSESELTSDVWSEVDNLLASFKTINGDCGDFLRDEGDDKGTWAKTVDVASKIWTYSDNAGGDADDSFYELMLTAVNAYNDATTEEEKNEQKGLVKEYTDMQKKECTKLEKAAGTVEAELGDFQTRCSDYSTKLGGHEKTLANIFNQEYGDITKLRADIDKQVSIIKAKQSKIDADRLIEKQEGYYEWIPLVGAIAAAIVTAVMETEIAELMDAIQKLNDIITADNEKIRIISFVQGHVTNMKSEVHDLNEVLTPAITTLGKLKGAWQTMGTMLDALNQAFDRENDEIDHPSIEKTEINKVRRKWNDLRDYTQKYQEIAYLTDSPKENDLQGYYNELKEHSNS